MVPRKIFRPETKKVRRGWKNFVMGNLIIYKAYQLLFGG